MHIQINTDSNIEGDNALAQQVEIAARETDGQGRSSGNTSMTRP